MSKKCPECGERLPNLARFCGNCGHSFSQDNNSKKTISNGIFSNGKMIVVLIAIVIVIAAGAFFAMGLGGDNQASDDNQHEVDLTITEVNGYSSSTSSPKSYSLYTYAIFNKVPSDLKGYNVKTTYVDENGTEIGHETETLSNVYYDSDYSISFGYYTTYKKPNPDHVNVEIIKDGKTLDEFTAKIDQGKIEFLN